MTKPTFRTVTVMVPYDDTKTFQELVDLAKIHVDKGADCVKVVKVQESAKATIEISYPVGSERYPNGRILRDE